MNDERESETTLLMTFHNRLTNTLYKHLTNDIDKKSNNL